MYSSRRKAAKAKSRGAHELQRLELEMRDKASDQSQVVPVVRWLLGTRPDVDNKKGESRQKAKKDFYLQFNFYFSRSISSYVS